MTFMEGVLRRLPWPVLALVRKLLPFEARVAIGRWVDLGAAMVGPAPARRRALRAWFYDRVEPYTAVLAIDVDGRRLLLPTGDEIVGRKTFVEGRPQELPMLARALAYAGPGDVLEVGANIGTTTVFLAGGGRRVVAIEPEPRNFALLEANVAANGLSEQVQCLRLAITDAEGEVVLELSPTNAGDHRVRTGSGPAAMDEESRSTITVPARTVDALVADGVVREPGLVWLDVQGNEGHVLAGAERLLAGGVPVVVEVWPYGLTRAGGLELLLAAVERHFRAVLELPGGEQEIPVSEFRALVARVGTRPQDMTDVLLLPAA